MRPKPPINTMYALALLCGAGAGYAQTTQWQPPTDSSAQASPVNSPTKAPVNDSSAQASPIASQRHSSASFLAPHTALHVVLTQSLDSGHLTNGQTVHARLAADTPARTGKPGSSRGVTPVMLTVVGTVPAGKIYAVGELSLQVERVGNTAVTTDILTFRGKPGRKDLPDSAPATGTDAGLASGTQLTFHVLPEPMAAEGAPKAGTGPGSVNGIASGAVPPPGSGPVHQQSGTQKTGNIPSGRTPPTTAPATNTFGPPQELGQPSPAPNQPAPPAQTTGTGQPN